jgi:hypothetical protein
MRATGSGKPRRARGPIELLVVTGLGVLSGALEIIVGVLVIFARYLSSVIHSHLQEVVTLLGAGLVLIGLLTAAVAWGLTRGDSSARIIVTVLLGLGSAVAVAGIVADPEDLLIGVVPLVLSMAAVVVMWTGRTARYFARQAT